MVGKDAMMASETERNSAGEAQHCSMIVRGGVVIADPRHEAGAIEDGAVCIRDDRIVAVGPYDSLRQDFIAEKILGSKRHLVIPGLVNAHDHGRAPSTLQLGVPDDQLELWILDLLRLPGVDPYLSAAFACIQMIESGVTTVVHSYYEGRAGRYGPVLADTARAFEDSGMRAAMVLSILDQSIIETLLRGLTPGLPDHLKVPVQGFLEQRSRVMVEEYLDVLQEWHGKQQTERVWMMTGPVSVHWCSEDLLLRIWHEAEALGMGIQTHLLESPYQQREALARYGKSAVEYLADLGLLSPRLSCAHCVYVTERDIELLADSGTSVVHNASSNLRLCNGIAPIDSMLRHGVNIALGLDSQALNDDDDMLQEMRLVATLQRALNGDVHRLTAGRALEMASINGARALGIDADVGTLAPGKKADLALLYPDSLDKTCAGPLTDMGDLLLHRAKAGDVGTVIINGEIVMHEGKHTRFDKENVKLEIGKLLARQTGAGERSLNAMIAELKPYARKLICG